MDSKSIATNGSAVGGPGNIAAIAGKPVMDGNGVGFKRFPDVDIIDREMNSQNADDAIKVCPFARTYLPRN